MLREHRELLDWLLLEGGLVIRYRTATELLDEEGGPRLAALTAELLKSPQVARWLKRLAPGVLHHSKPSAFENVCGKLAELGICAGMWPFDQRITPFIEQLENWEDYPAAFGSFYKLLLAAGLARTGLAPLACVRETVAKRLREIAPFFRAADFDIYVPAKELPNIPAAYRDKRFVRPKFFTGNSLNLPNLHDVLAVAHCQAWLNRMGYEDHINALVSFILDPAYQRLDEGYGYMWTQEGSPRKYYAIGWSVHLPGYFGFDLERYQQAALITRLEMMARFSAARRHPWFIRCLEHLEQFRQDGGTYILPRSYLREARTGYGVFGNHMGLEENRRTIKAIELESTFRMLRLRNQV